MNVCTLAVTDDEYRKIIDTLKRGYYHNGIQHRPNHRVAFALQLEYATGMRISDIVRLRQADIVKDGNRYRLDIKEKKTGKKRVFRINQGIYDQIDKFCADHNIPSDKPIVGGTTHGVQKQIRFVREYLGMGERISTHSFRKSASMRVYVNTGKDIVATQIFLNHSNPAVTSRYLNSCSSVLDEALDKMVM